MDDLSRYIKEQCERSPAFARLWRRYAQQTYRWWEVLDAGGSRLLVGEDLRRLKQSAAHRFSGRKVRYRRFCFRLDSPVTDDVKLR